MCCGFAESWQSSNQGTSLSLATALQSQMKSTIQDLRCKNTFECIYCDQMESYFINLDFPEIAGDFPEP